MTINKTSEAVTVIEQNIRDVHQLSFVDIDNIPAVVLKYKRMEEALRELPHAEDCLGEAHLGVSEDMSKCTCYIKDVRAALAFDPLSE